MLSTWYSFVLRLRVGFGFHQQLAWLTVAISLFNCSQQKMALQGYWDC